MLNCKQISQLISQSLDRKLTLRERFALKLHLFICNKCKQFSQHLQTLYIAIKTLIGLIESNNNIELPSASKQRISIYLEGKM